MNKTIDTYFIIILNIILLTFFIPNVAGKISADPTPKYQIYTIILFVIGVILLLGFLLIARKKKKHKKIITFCIILLIIGIILQSYYFATYKPWYEIWKENEEAKPKFQYYMPNRTIEEEKVLTYDPGNLQWPLSTDVIYYNDSFIIAYVDRYFDSDQQLTLEIIISNSLSQWNPPVFIDTIDHHYVSGKENRGLGNVVLTQIDNEIICYYSYLNYNLDGNDIYKKVKSINGLNWSNPETIDNYPYKVDYNDEISFPSKFEKYGYTDVNIYKVFKTRDNNYIMTIYFDGNRIETVYDIGTFLSYSLDGDIWSEPIRLIEPLNMNEPLIKETSSDQFIIFYYNSDGFFYSEFIFNDLINTTGPINDYK